MNSSEIKIERVRSLEKGKDELYDLQEEQQKIKSEKIGLMFELKILAREKKEIAAQVDSIKNQMTTLKEKKNIYSGLVVRTKSSLRIYKNQLESLNEQVVLLERTTNSMSQENYALSELVERVSSKVGEKQTEKEEYSAQLLEIEQDLIKRQDLFRELNTKFQDTTRRLDEFVLRKKNRQDDLDSINKKLREVQSSLEIAMIEEEKAKQEYICADSERVRKQEKLDLTCKNYDEVSDLVNSTNVKIISIKNELTDLTQKILLKSNEFEKLKELEMLTTLTYDHVQKEVLEFQRRIEVADEKILIKKKDLKSNTLKLREQQALFDSLKKHEQESSFKNLRLLEYIERTRTLVLTNQNLLDALFEECEAPPHLPTDC